MLSDNFPQPQSGGRNIIMVSRAGQLTSVIPNSRCRGGQERGGEGRGGGVTANTTTDIPPAPAPFSQVYI